MNAKSLSERTLGMVLVTGSAVMFGLAGVLTKSITTDSLVIACWRGLVGSILIGLYVVWRSRHGDIRRSLTLGWRGWALVVVGAAASVAFISSFKFSYVANVTIIYATVPFVTALLGWLLLSERMGARSLMTAAVALIGVSVMVFSSLHAGVALGDGLAVVMTALSALYIVLIRMFRDVPVVWAGAVSAFLLFVLGWVVTDPLIVSGRDVILLAAFGASFAVAVVLWTEGARLLPAAESALLGLAELPCAILFAWLFLGEMPPGASMLGGAIVLAAVLWHSGRDWMDGRVREPMQAG